MGGLFVGFFFLWLVFLFCFCGVGGLFGFFAVPKIEVPRQCVLFSHFMYGA